MRQPTLKSKTRSQQTPQHRLFLLDCASSQLAQRSVQTSEMTKTILMLSHLISARPPNNPPAQERKPRPISKQGYLSKLPMSSFHWLMQPWSESTHR
eukprot:6360229-Amphidinium_carterae.1